MRPYLRQDFDKYPVQTTHDVHIAYSHTSTRKLPSVILVDDCWDEYTVWSSTNDEAGVHIHQKE